jgi:hypothetical protein
MLMLLLKVRRQRAAPCRQHYYLVGLDPRLKRTRFNVNATKLFDKVYVAQCIMRQFDNACAHGLRRQVVAILRYRWRIVKNQLVHRASNCRLRLISILQPGFFVDNPRDFPEVEGDMAWNACRKPLFLSRSCVRESR